MNVPLYPKIAPGPARNSASTDLCLGNSRDSSSTGTLPDSPGHGQNNIRKQQRVQRQSHTKSRAGCWNCKRRRIKCEENRPSCTQCTKRRLQCEWPEIQIRDGRAALQRGFSSPSVPAQLRSADSVFTMQDFRLFYYFIEKAYPHHPIGNDWVWKHEIPSISHNYDYLMHGMLGLSASELATSVEPTPELISSAMSHRVLAIKALGQALSKGLRTFEEGNAMLATCYVLLFQSVLLEDGLGEYMSFIRGCVLIAQNMGCKRMKFLFHSFLRADTVQRMEPHLAERQEVNSGSIHAACKSLEAFGPLCQREYEKSFHNSLLKVVRALYTSSRNAYLGLTEIYESFSYTMSHEDFQHFINPENEIGQILLSHFVAVQLLLSPITVNEMGHRKLAKPSNESRHWLSAIHRRALPRMKKYFMWPMSVAESVETASVNIELSGDNPSMLQEEDDVSETMQNGI